MFQSEGVALMCLCVGTMVVASGDAWALAGLFRGSRFMRRRVWGHRIVATGVTELDMDPRFLC